MCYRGTIVQASLLGTQSNAVDDRILLPWWQRTGNGHILTAETLEPSPRPHYARSSACVGKGTPSGPLQERVRVTRSAL
jgi:hypothetical protein